MGRAFEVRKEAKAKSAAAKTKVYSKYGREIYVAAKNGLPDPELNQELKRVIEKAKKDQVPNDIINRAIDKAKGQSDESYTQITYEGFGPGDSLLIISCLTDNVNRTIAEIRAIFNKLHCKMGVSGSCSFQFSHVCVLKANLTEDQALEIFIEAELDPKKIENTEDGLLIYGEVGDYYNLKQALLNYNKDLELLVDTITYVPFTYTQLEGENLQKFEKMLDLLEDLDDVQEVYHNVDL